MISVTQQTRITLHPTHPVWIRRHNTTTWFPYNMYMLTYVHKKFKIERCPQILVCRRFMSLS